MFSCILRTADVCRRRLSLCGHRLFLLVHSYHPRGSIKIHAFTDSLRKIDVKPFLAGSWFPKNALGVLFYLSGLAMLILPGQGLLTIFIGLVLLDFPRKRVLVRRLLGYRRILG
jgi:hypothetical protein